MNRQEIAQTEFLKKGKDLVLEGIKKNEFGLLDFCKGMNLSRSQTHNYIKKYSGVSTSVFIRNVKLNFARNLLETTALNISQTAYSSGFNDVSYFSRLFKNKFGVSPRQLINNIT